jgi:hypothetical protein
MCDTCTCELYKFKIRVPDLWALINIKKNNHKVKYRLNIRMFVWERENNIESEKQLWILIFNKLNVKGRNKKKILNRKKIKI